MPLYPVDRFQAEKDTLLRILLWKLGIEWAHVLRALWPRHERKIYYFAFGANLSDKVLHKRKIRVFESFDYILPDAELRFSQLGFYRDHGYASADAAEGGRVYGRMLQILERDAVRMDYFEGVPVFRAHDKIVGQGDGIEYYFYRTTRVYDDLKPTREYLDYLLDAYREMPQVPAEYIERLAATPVLEVFEPLDETGLFVRDLERWPRWLHAPLVAYEGLCMRLVEAVWHRSLLQWMIPGRGISRGD